MHFCMNILAFLVIHNMRHVGGNLVCHIINMRPIPCGCNSIHKADLKHKKTCKMKL